MQEKRSLHLLWTNADPTTAQLMVMMYATNSIKRGWWDEVTVIIWGATAKLVAEDEFIQDLVAENMRVGVKFSACISCARQLGVVDKLEELGVEVIPWGAPLTEILQNGGHLLTV